MALGLAFGAEVAVRGWPSGPAPREPWLYVGGALGVCIVATTAWVVRHIGVLLLGLAGVAGQLIGAVVVDAVAPGGRAPNAVTLAAAALTLVAVGVATLPARRGGGRVSGPLTRCTSRGR